MFNTIKNLIKSTYTKHETSQKFKNVFSTAEGQEVLEIILKRSGVCKSTFNADSNISAYQQGAADIGLYILKNVESTNHKPKKEEK